MKKRHEAAVGFLGGLMLTAAANLSARALAQVRAHARSNLLSDSTSAELLRLLPATLVAGACLHAIVFHSRRALYLVLSCTVPVYALWSYLGELGFHQAIATRHWTAAALSSGLAALASLAFVMLGIPIAFFLESRFGRRSAPLRGTGSPTTNRTNRTVVTPLLSGGCASSFACPTCGAMVNFGASQCGSCEELFDYPKPVHTAE